MRATSVPHEETDTQQAAPRQTSRPGHRWLLAKVAGAFLLGGFAILFSGIALGNAARKRADRWMRGY